VNEKFLIEEYNAKWSYLKHLEDKWDSVLKWYVAIVGSLASVSIGATAVNVNLSSIQAPASAFAVVYSLFVSLYILTQKRGYRRYHQRVVEIEKMLLGTDPKPGYSTKERLLNTSRIYLCFPALLGGGLSSLFVFAIDGGAGWSIFAFAVFAALIIGLSFVKHLK